MRRLSALAAGHREPVAEQERNPKSDELDTSLKGLPGVGSKLQTGELDLRDDQIHQVGGRIPRHVSQRGFRLRDDPRWCGRGRSPRDHCSADQVRTSSFTDFDEVDG